MRLAKGRNGPVQPTCVVLSLFSVNFVVLFEVAVIGRVPVIDTFAA